MMVVDLFCGMGGLSYGFSHEGFKVIGFDKSEYAVLSFNLNKIGKGLQKDLLLPMKKLEDKDQMIIIGGPPCEPWSRLNVQKKFSAHPLHKCVLRFYKIVFRERPILFIMENVPDILKDTMIHKILKKAKTLYSLAHKSIRYSDYGAATSRKRLFIIGVKKGYGVRAENIFDRIPLGKSKSVKDAIWDLRRIGWNREIDHIWPRVRTIKKYLKYYRLGKYGWYILRWDRPSPSFGNITKTYILHPDSFNGGEMRPISVRETLRIMGFPDKYKFPKNIPLYAKYEMVADAVSPVFSLKLARVIKKLF